MYVTRKPLLLLLVLGLGLWATACSFSVSTANIGGLKMGKDEALQQETNTFEADDTLYSVVTIANNPGTVSVKGRLHVVEIEGQTPGPIQGLETTVTVLGSNTATFHFTKPNNGWPAGKYKFEALMLNENGETKDSKSQDFTVN